MMTNPIEASDIYDLLSACAAGQLGDNPAKGSELATYLSEQSTDMAAQFSQTTTLKIQLEHHHFVLQQVLQRCAVEAWRDFRRPRINYTDLPARCPKCAELLAGQWHCNLCGLELYRWQKHTGSDDSMGALPWGYALLPDPRRNRLIFLRLEPKTEVVWQVSLPARLNLNIRSALFLPNQEILLSSPNGKVVIVNLFGNVIWECKLPLIQPVYAGASQDGQTIYIADAGLQQVFKLNRDQQVLWSYGSAGQAGHDENYLNQPHCLFESPEGAYLIADTGNHRVLEISELSQKVKRIWGPELDLAAPTRVAAYPERYLSILDPSQFRLLDFLDAEVESDCTYYQNGLDPRYRLTQAFGAIRRENGHFVLSNTERAVEISPLQKRLLWFSLLTDLRLPLLPETPPVPASEKALPSTHLRSPFKLEETLKQVSVFATAPDEFFQKIKLCLRYEEYPAGHILIREGQRGDAMFVIKHGEVEILKEFQSVAILGSGDLFGEMALLNQASRNATVRIRSKVQLYRLNRLAFETVVQSFPEIYQRIKTLAHARQLTESDGQAIVNPAMSSESAKERLQKLMDSHKERLANLRSKARPPVSAGVQAAGPIHWTLKYSSLEQELIREAQFQNYRCLEMHIRLHPQCKMKSVRVSLLVMNLEKSAEIIKTHPLPEDILKEAFDSQVVLTVLTHASRSHLIEEALRVAEIEDVQAIPVQF